MGPLVNVAMLTILTSVVVFLVIILVLVIMILVAKAKLVPSGNVKITINGEKELEVPMGNTLLNTLQSVSYTHLVDRGGLYLRDSLGSHPADSYRRG